MWMVVLLGYSPLFPYVVGGAKHIIWTFIATPWVTRGVPVERIVRFSLKQEDS